MHGHYRTVTCLAVFESRILFTFYANQSPWLLARRRGKLKDVENKEDVPQHVSNIAKAFSSESCCRINITPFDEIISFLNTPRRYSNDARNLVSQSRSLNIRETFAIPSLRVRSSLLKKKKKERDIRIDQLRYNTITIPKVAHV